jgi:hypothetical protein
MKTTAILAALAALAIPAAAADRTVTFITGTIDSLEAEGYTDANGRWQWSTNAVKPTVSESNGVRRVSFSLGAGQSLEYHPVVECPTNGTAEVVVSNALMRVATALPATANPDHQASITAAKPAGEETAAYYGWAGKMTNGVPVWFRLAGATPAGDGTEVAATLSFDYAKDPATVSFKIDDATLHSATNAEETLFALATTNRQVRYLSFTGQGSIGAMSGTAVVFDTTPPAVEPGEGLLEDDPAAVETTTDGFVVRFRTKKAGVTYTLLSCGFLSRDDRDWKPVSGDGATGFSTAAAESATGEIVELKAPIPGDQPVQFYRIRANW